MSYDFRKEGSRSTIIDLIVAGALRERSVVQLVNAYLEELENDSLEGDDETGEGADMSSDAWLKRHRILKTTEEVERVMHKTYINVYRQFVGHPLSAEEAGEVFVYPIGFPETMVPQKIVVEVATALARQDAADARAMRREMLRRHQSKA